MLAATDGSEGASRAVEMAARLSKQLGEELLIVTVGKGRLSADEILEAKHQGMSEGEALEILSREILSDAKKHARSAGASAIRVLACVGDPAELILDVARRERVDMLIVGRRGRGRLAGLLLGSVSQKMASLAPCSVVLVP
ncbi:MAG: universal stress protein [Betaproteobacteria bacterium]|nr:MAG: universal stress protein [Betaproteobacteria bacterium]